jgi:hypothetical protein
MSHRVSAKHGFWVASLLLVACSRPKPAESGAALGSTEPSTETAAPEPTPAATPSPAAVAPAPPAAATAQTLFVRERRNDCQGEAPMKCLQVRESPGDPWRNFFGRIEGFDYEEGTTYELRVEVTPVASPAADASSLRYRLVEVLSQRKIEGAKP